MSHHRAAIPLMDGVGDEGTNSSVLFCSTVRDAYRVPAVPGEGQEGDNGPHPQVSVGTCSKVDTPPRS